MNSLSIELPGTYSDGIGKNPLNEFIILLASLYAGDVVFTEYSNGSTNTFNTPTS